jgi:hypothetical protein
VSVQSEENESVELSADRDPELRAVGGPRQLPPAQ